MSKKNNKIKLEDIAKRLNVTKVTVSKALRDHPDISQATIKLVKSTAQKMGYVPNFTARNLSSKRTNTIGIVVPKIAHYFFGSIAEALYEAAYKNDYELILTVSQEDEQRERKHIETLLAMNVDGLIVAISKETNDYSIFNTVKRHNVPMVFIDRIPELNNVNKVRVSDEHGTFEAIEHAIHLGHQKLLYLASYKNINIGKERISGFKKALRKNKIKLTKNSIIHGGFKEEFGYQTIMNLHRLSDLPQMVFTETYPVALGIYKAAYELRLKIPNDLDVICFGNADVQEFLNPPLSCVAQPTSTIAEKAVELLLENIINKENFRPKEIVIPTELIIRGTCTKNQAK